MPLDSFATVPKECFAAADSWGEDVDEIPEHYFAVQVVDENLSVTRAYCIPMGSI